MLKLRRKSQLINQLKNLRKLRSLNSNLLIGLKKLNSNNNHLNNHTDQSLLAIHNLTVTGQILIL